jgi:hypothetical protein
VDIQDIGSIGELIAAIATIGTLAYLAFQVRQSTRALRSSTFQNITNDMSVSSEAVTTHPDLSEVLTKAADGLAALSPAEHMRFSFFFLMTLRRLESVFIQREHGFIDAELTGGFERSVLSAIASGGGLEWWETAKPAFSPQFAEYVDRRLASDGFPRIHPNLGGSGRSPVAGSPNA